MIDTIQNERDQAVAAGINDDWWEGVSKKGVSTEEQKTAAQGRKMMRKLGTSGKEILGMGMGMEERLGLE